MGSISLAINSNCLLPSDDGASQSSKASKSVSSIVISSSKNSSSDATGTEGLAGGSGSLICSVWGISKVSISSCMVFVNFCASPKNLGNT